MGTGTATPTVGIVRDSGSCGMRITTPKVAGRSFGVRVGRSGSLIVSVRGGARDARNSGRNGGRDHCLHHRFSCSGFRRALVLPSSMSGSGVSTGMGSNMLAVRLPGHAPRSGRGTTGIVRIGWRTLGFEGRKLPRERFLFYFCGDPFLFPVDPSWSCGPGVWVFRLWSLWSSKNGVCGLHVTSSLPYSIPCYLLSLHAVPHRYLLGVFVRRFFRNVL